MPREGRSAEDEADEPASQRFAANPKTMEMISREVEIMKNLDHVR